MTPEQDLKCLPDFSFTGARRKGGLEHMDRLNPQAWMGCPPISTYSLTLAQPRLIHRSTEITFLS